MGRARTFHLSGPPFSGFPRPGPRPCPSLRFCMVTSLTGPREVGPVSPSSLLCDTVREVVAFSATWGLKLLLYLDPFCTGPSKFFGCTGPSAVESPSLRVYRSLRACGENKSHPRGSSSGTLQPVTLSASGGLLRSLVFGRVNVTTSRFGILVVHSCRCTLPGCHEVASLPGAL